jgi:hypothetical protein
MYFGMNDCNKDFLPIVIETIQVFLSSLVYFDLKLQNVFLVLHRTK